MTLLRSLRRDRWYPLTTAVVAALAIGANLVVLTIVDAIWLRPRPVDAPERLVVLMRDLKSSDDLGFSPIGLQVLAESPVFESVAGQVVTTGQYAAFRPSITIAGTSRRFEAGGVSVNYFSVLGIAPAGRGFSAGDEGAPLAVISDEAWTTAFARRADIIGLRVAASPKAFVIAGIAPPGFRGARLGETVDLWFPHDFFATLGSVPPETIGQPGFTVPLTPIARLRPGESVAAAEAALHAWRFRNLHLIPFNAVFAAPDRAMVVIEAGRMVSVVLATSALVLGGGCLTLMGLVIVHYERRRREFAVRSALGADRTRLFRLVLGELSIVTILSVAAAVAIAKAVLPILPRLNLSDGLDLRRLSLQLDWRVTSIGALLTIATVLIAGVVPLLRVTRAAGLESALSMSNGSPRSAISVRRTVLALQVAFALIVLSVAGLFVRTIGQAFGSTTGFDVSRTLFVDLQTWYPGRASSALAAQQDARVLASSELLLTRLKAIPGVEAVALGSAPIGPSQAMQLNMTRATAFDAGTVSIPIGWNFVSENYLDVIGAHVRVGALPGASDHGKQTAVITSTLAQVLWPGEWPIGRQITAGVVDYTVTGVADLPFGSLRFGSVAAVFVPNAEIVPGMYELNLVIRSSRPDVVRPAVEETIRTVFPDAPRVTIESGTAVVEADIGREILGAWFFSGFGGIALSLSVAAVFGLVAFISESRTREFAILIALGATSGHVMRRAAAGAIGPTALGAVTGLVAGAIATGVCRAVLPGLAASDLRIPVTVAAVLLLCGIAAAGLAAERLRHIAPARALQAE